MYPRRSNSFYCLPCSRWKSKLVADTVTKVQQAIRRGELRRKPCEVCGNRKSHGHHDDYSKPLTVRWLCAKHHQQHHYQPQHRR